MNRTNDIKNIWYQSIDFDRLSNDVSNKCI